MLYHNTNLQYKIKWKLVPLVAQYQIVQNNQCYCLEVLIAQLQLSQLKISQIYGEAKKKTGIKKIMSKMDYHIILYFLHNF